MPKRYDKIYLLFEHNRKLVDMFMGDSCLIAPSEILQGLNLGGKNTLSLEALFDGKFFEMAYQENATAFLNDFSKRTCAI